MPLIRLLLLLGIFAGLALFALQNWSPPLQLVFLGLRSQPFPLAVLILVAIAAGAVTTLVITTLLGLSSYASEIKLRSRLGNAYRSYTTPRTASPRPRSPQTGQTGTSGQGYTTTPNQESKWDESDDFEWDDIEAAPSDGPRSSREEAPDEPKSADRTWIKEDDEDEWDDWDDDENEDDDEDENNLRDSGRSRTSFEVPQVPKSRSQSGSVYSYGYLDPGNSGVGKSEPIAKPVVDAEYRVIVPPYRNPDAKNDRDQDEFDDDDDWDGSTGDRRRNDW